MEVDLALRHHDGDVTRRALRALQLGEKVLERRPRCRRDPGRKALAQDAQALHSEQGRADQVDLEDRAVGVERDVNDWREIVEVRVAGRARLEFVPRAPELLVLELELDPVDLELVDEAHHVLARRDGGGPTGAPAAAALHFGAAIALSFASPELMAPRPPSARRRP